MLSLNEAAETSGVNIKRIKQAINENELPVYEFGPHTKRVLLSDLRRWWRRFKAEGFYGISVSLETKWLPAYKAC
jgi:hypothetical protein